MRHCPGLWRDPHALDTLSPIVNAGYMFRLVTLFPTPLYTILGLLLVCYYLSKHKQTHSPAVYERCPHQRDIDYFQHLSLGSLECPGVFEEPGVAGAVSRHQAQC